MKKSNSWGGKRPNAGAKKKDRAKKTVSYCLNLSTIATIEHFNQSQSKSKNLDDLIEQNQKIKKILGVSNMKGIQHLLDIEPSYFGGIYDRLGQVSRWLTALAWHKYPNKSYDNLHKRLEKISPRLAELINEYGISFAIVAPNENDPSASPSWQLIHNCQGFTNRNEEELRAYLLELFFDIPSEYSDEIARIYEDNFDELEQIGDLFEQELIAEVLDDLKALELSIDDLVKAADSFRLEQVAA